MTTVAIYARVSSERQVQANTIESQIEALKTRIINDEFTLLEEHQYIDNGYSGSNLIRPALERLRDQVAAGAIDKVYIHSPDRLSRKYTYQMILVEEFEKSGTEVIFLNFQINDNPEANLLLQMQGMISEYERSKIMERHRRGKIYAAKRGSVNVLVMAPYGYKYIDKHFSGGEASFEIIEEEAEVVRKIFNWVGKGRLTLSQVARRLREENIITRKGKTFWNRCTIYQMVKNPTYKGQAAFGKSKTGAKLPRVRPRKGEQPRNNFSKYPVEEKDWIYIPVPAIIEKDLFDVVQEQLEENKKMARAKNQRRTTYLLQGLIMCKQCGRGYSGYAQIKRDIKSKDKTYLYYRCTGTQAYRFGGPKMCFSKQVGGDAIEELVWGEVKNLLKHPKRIFDEYQRRLTEIEQNPVDHTYDSIEKQRIKLEKSISLLIDGYTQQYIVKSEFEPRIKTMRQKLKVIQEQQKKLMGQKNFTKDIELIINNLENFACEINTKLDNLAWNDKRDIIRRIVKRIEIEEDKINIVYRVAQASNNESDASLQHCCSSKYTIFFYFAIYQYN